MAGAKYTSCALAVLAWAGMGRAEPPAPQSAGDPVVTVQEVGKPKHQCVIVSTTVQPDGSRLYELQALDTGQRMTISEPPIGQNFEPKTASSAHGALYHLFHGSDEGDKQGAGAAAGGPPALQAPPANAFSTRQAPVLAGTPSAFTPPPVTQPNIAAAFPVGPTGSQTANAFPPSRPTPPAPSTPAAAALPPATDHAANVPASLPAPTGDASQLPASAPVEPASPSKWQAPAMTSPPSTTMAPVNQSLPQADGSRPDPLQNMETYTNWPPTNKKIPQMVPPAPETTNMDSPIPPSVATRVPASGAVQAAATAPAPAAVAATMPTSAAAPMPAPCQAVTSAGTQAISPVPCSVAAGSSVCPCQTTCPCQSTCPCQPACACQTPCACQPVSNCTSKPLPQTTVPVKMDGAKPDLSKMEAPTPPGLGGGSVVAAGSGFYGPNAFVPAATPPVPLAPPPVPPAPVPPGGFVSAPPPPPPAVLANAFTSSPDPKADAASGGAFHSAGWYRLREMGTGAAFPNSSAMAYQAPARAPTAATQPIMQASYQQATAPVPSLEMLVTTLREALLPSAREDAAERLGEFDWHVHTEVADALASCASHDPCPAVRVGCLRTLVRLQVNNALMRVTLEELRNDPNAGVRQEATNALRMLSWPTGTR